MYVDVGYSYNLHINPKQSIFVIFLKDQCLILDIHCMRLV